MTDRQSQRVRLLVAMALAAGLLTGSSAQAEAPAAIVESIKTISFQPNFYAGWPTLTRRANDELLLVWSGGREAHVCPFGQVQLMRSSDGGRTWTFPRVLIDSAIDDRDAGILVTDRGTLLATTFTSLAYEPGLAKAEESASWEPEKLKRWIAARDRLTAEQRQQQLGTWMIRSTDGGREWSALYRVPVNSPHGPIQLSDGRQLYAGKELWNEQNRIGVCQSLDDGMSWEWLATIPTRAGDDHHNYHELHAAEAADGRLLVHIRNHNSKNSGETLQSESGDGGKTWSEPHSIGIWGLPSHLLRLRDGRLLMSYGHRRQPFGNQARISSDNGQTWSEAMTISSDGVTGDLGYPSTVELDDNGLVTVWYEVRPGNSNAVLRQARWKIGE
ncbi:MAG: exo-alpha-sialidase [Rhodopirellula sp.]|nr:exo-alpha-sialidase [Rhodopirellula sp.]